MLRFSSELYKRCRATLLRCSEFNTQASLNAVFVTEELVPFQDRLPEAASKSERVERCLDFLRSQQLQDGRCGLLLFLEALRDRYDPHDMLHRELETVRTEILDANKQASARTSGHSAEQSVQRQTEIPALPKILEIFVSYCGDDEGLAAAQELDRFFREKGITILTDTSEIGYKGRFDEYVTRLGQGRYVIVVLSKGYFQSKRCMQELLLLAGHADVYDRIFPVMVEGMNIGEAEEMLKYANYWDEKIEHLQHLLHNTKNLAHLQGIHDDLNLYTDIRQQIAGLLDFLRKINTQPLTGLNFEPLYQAILSMHSLKTQAETSVAMPEKQRKNVKEIVVPLNLLRQRLNQLFDDPGFDAFCLDHFPDVYDTFSRGMRKDEKMTVLLDACRRVPAFYQKLVAMLEREL